MRMRVADSLRDLFENGDEAGAVLPGLVSGARLEQCRQRLPFDEFHGQERLAVGHRAQLVYGRNAGMLELPGDLCFENKALSGSGVGRVILAEQLDGHFPVELQVARLVDRAHAAPADFAQKLIAGRSQNRNRRRAGGGRRSGLESRFLDLRRILRHSPLLLKRLSALFAQTWCLAQSAVVKKRVKNGQSLKMTMKRVNKIRSPFFDPPAPLPGPRQQALDCGALTPLWVFSDTNRKQPTLNPWECSAMMDLRGNLDVRLARDAGLPGDTLRASFSKWGRRKWPLRPMPDPGSVHRCFYATTT